MYDNVHPTNGPESESTEVESSCPISHEKERHQALKLSDNVKEWSIECLQQLHSHLKHLFKKSEKTMGYERAFNTLFGQDIETFTVQMTLYLDQLLLQLDREHSSTERSTAALSVIYSQLQVFIDSKFTLMYDFDSQMTEKCFANHTGVEVYTFRDSLLQLMGNVKKYIMEKAQNEPMDDDKVKACREQSRDGIVELDNALDVGSVVTKCKDSFHMSKASFG